MASLPSTPFLLTGGCFCKAISYNISVPAISDRPIIPKVPQNPFGPQTESHKHFPAISLDHCNSCRRISVSIVECWFICPQRWVTWVLQPRTASAQEGQLDPIDSATVLRPSQSLQDSTHLRHFASSKDAHRTFCGKCGTHLSYYYSEKEDVMARENNFRPYFDISLGTMEKRCLEMEGMRPGREGWLDDGIGWVKDLLKDGEKSFLETKGEGRKPT